MLAYGDSSLVDAVLDDFEAAELEPRLRTTLEFLKQLTLEPWSVDPDALAPMRAAGVSDAAIEEAIRVCTCFSVVDRLADAFAFRVSRGRQLRLVKLILSRRGYAGAALPG